MMKFLTALVFAAWAIRGIFAAPVCLSSPKTIKSYVADMQDVWNSMTCEKAVAAGYCNSPNGRNLLEKYCGKAVAEIHAIKGVAETSLDHMQFCLACGDLIFDDAFQPKDVDTSRKLRDQVNVSSIEEGMKLAQSYLPALRMFEQDWGALKSLLLTFGTSMVNGYDLTAGMKSFHDMLATAQRLISEGYDLQLENLMGAVLKGVLKQGSERSVLKITVQSFTEDFITNYFTKFLDLMDASFGTPKERTDSQKLQDMLAFYETVSGFNKDWGWNSDVHGSVLVAMINHNNFANAYRSFADMYENLNCFNYHRIENLTLVASCKAIPKPKDAATNQSDLLGKAVASSVRDCSGAVSLNGCKPSPENAGYVYVCPREFKNICPDLLAPVDRTSSLWDLDNHKKYVGGFYKKLNVCLQSCAMCELEVNSEYALINRTSWDEVVDESTEDLAIAPLSELIVDPQTAALQHESNRFREATLAEFLSLKWLIPGKPDCELLSHSQFCGFKHHSGDAVLNDACRESVYKQWLVGPSLRMFMTKDNFQWCNALTHVALHNGTLIGNVPAAEQVSFDYTTFQKAMKKATTGLLYGLITYNSVTAQVVRECANANVKGDYFWMLNSVKTFSKFYVEHYKDPAWDAALPQIVKAFFTPPDGNYRGLQQVRDEVFDEIVAQFDFRAQHANSYLWAKFSGLQDLSFAKAVKVILNLMNYMICPTAENPVVQMDPKQPVFGSTNKDAAETLMCSPGDIKTIYKVIGVKNTIHLGMEAIGAYMDNNLKCHQMVQESEFLGLQCGYINVSKFKSFELVNTPEQLYPSMVSHLKTLQDLVDMIGCSPSRENLAVMYFAPREWLAKCKEAHMQPGDGDLITNYILKSVLQKEYEQLIDCALSGRASAECEMTFDGNFEIQNKKSFYKSTTTTTRKTTSTTTPPTPTPKPPILPVRFLPIRSEEPLDSVHSSVLMSLNNYVNNAIVPKMSQNQFCNLLISLGLCSTHHDLMKQYCPQALRTNKLQVDVADNVLAVSVCVLFSELIHLKYIPQSKVDYADAFNAMEMEPMPNGRLLAEFFADKLAGAKTWPNLVFDSNVLSAFNIPKSYDPFFKDLQAFLQYYAFRYGNSTLSGVGGWIFALVRNQVAKMSLTPAEATNLFTGFNCPKHLSGELLQSTQCAIDSADDEFKPDALDDAMALAEIVLEKNFANCKSLLQTTGCDLTHYTFPVAYFCLDSWKAQCLPEGADGPPVYSLPDANSDVVEDPNILAYATSRMMSGPYKAIQQCSASQGQNCSIVLRNSDFSFSMLSSEKPLQSKDEDGKSEANDATDEAPDSKNKASYEYKNPLLPGESQESSYSGTSATIAISAGAALAVAVAAVSVLLT